MLTFYFDIEVEIVQRNFLSSGIFYEQINHYPG